MNVPQTMKKWLAAFKQEHSHLDCLKLTETHSICYKVEFQLKLCVFLSFFLDSKFLIKIIKCPFGRKKRSHKNSSGYSSRGFNWMMKILKAGTCENLWLAPQAGDFCGYFILFPVWRIQKLSNSLSVAIIISYYYVYYDRNRFFGELLCRRQEYFKIFRRGSSMYLHTRQENW